eukprot:scaffold77442_cov15-Tisochrysis_lutea.AAC.1
MSESRVQNQKHNHYALLGQQVLLLPRRIIKRGYKEVAILNAQSWKAAKQVEVVDIRKQQMSCSSKVLCAKDKGTL